MAPVGLPRVTESRRGRSAGHPSGSAHLRCASAASRAVLAFRFSSASLFGLIAPKGPAWGDLSGVFVRGFPPCLFDGVSTPILLIFFKLQSPPLVGRTREHARRRMPGGLAPSPLFVSSRLRTTARCVARAQASAAAAVGGTRAGKGGLRRAPPPEIFSLSQPLSQLVSRNILNWNGMTRTARELTFKRLFF